MLLLLTLMAPTLLFVKTPDDGVTFDFQHIYLHSSCYKAYCLDILLMQSVTSTVYYVYCVHPLCLSTKNISNYAKFKTLGNSIPTKETHHVTDIAPVQLYHTELQE
jgi:hypothetical protein